MEKSAFLFYGSFQDSIKELPDETRLRFYDAIINYGLTGEVPNFSGLEKALWLQIQFAIDEAKNRREISKNNGSKGGRPVKNTKPTETENNPEKPDHNLNVDVDVDVEVDEDVEGEREAEQAAAALAPSAQLYANKIFDLFTAAGLPNAGGNRVTFLMRDFKNGIDYLHSQSNTAHLHSSDVIGACENYIKTLQDPGTYVKNKYSFERFTKIKNFQDFLPDNFVPEHFKSWDQPGAEPEAKKLVPAADPFKKNNAPRICEFCREPTRESASGGGFLAVSCTRCGSWAEFDPETKKWEWTRRS